MKGNHELTVTALVSSNTAAEVVLPGDSDGVEVGSGRHTWTVPFDADPAERTPLSVDMSMDDLLDREEAARAFKELMTAYVPEAAAFIEGGSGAPQALRSGPSPGCCPVATASSLTWRRSSRPWTAVSDRRVCPLVTSGPPGQAAEVSIQRDLPTSAAVCPDRPIPTRCGTRAEGRPPACHGRGRCPDGSCRGAGP